MDEGDAGRTPWWRRAVRAADGVLPSIAELASGMETAALALGTLLLLAAAAVTVPLGVGVLLARAGFAALHATADRERARLAKWGPEVVGPAPPPTRPRAALADAATRRELRWAARHGTAGLAAALLCVWLMIFALRDGAFPLYWWTSSTGSTPTGFGTDYVRSWSGALAVCAGGFGCAAALLLLARPLARGQAAPGRRLLAAGPGDDLALRVAELTATRAAALDAHAAELRRIERSLHDGAQNRLVAVTVLLGAARRQVARNPEGADEVLERAHTAAEQALAELRSVVRSILPPVLADRGLAGALAGLAAHCPVPCRVEVDAPGRSPASVESTAYFVAAEALTNVARHSGARRAALRVRVRDGRLQLRVQDDGRGGADAGAGSGLAGIRDRVAALDGTLRLASPAGGPTTLEVDLPCGR